MPQLYSNSTIVLQVHPGHLANFGSQLGIQSAASDFHTVFTTDGQLYPLMCKLQLQPFPKPTPAEEDAMATNFWHHAGRKSGEARLKLPSATPLRRVSQTGSCLWGPAHPHAGHASQATSSHRPAATQPPTQPPTNRQPPVLTGTHITCTYQ